MIWSVKRFLASASVLCLNQVAAAAQIVELGDVRLLSSSDPPGQSAVFELINKTDRTISQLAVSCNLVDETGRALAVKVVRFRNVLPGSSIDPNRMSSASRLLKKSLVSSA